ncbi:MAG: hypothetical protein JWN17_2030 [Frankiales bacterium]|nr:hypothetical protein [Frankiales bacterium]
MTTTPADVLAAYPARYCAAWGQHDVATALEVVAPDVHWVDPLLPEPFTGHEGAAGFFQGAWQGFPDLAFELVGEPLVDAANNRVTAEWVMTGTHTGEFPPGAPVSGNAFRVAGSDTWEVDAEGRALSVHAYYDTLTLLKAIGLA